MKKTIFWITILIFLLFVIAYFLLSKEEFVKKGWFLDFEEAKGIEVDYRGQMYTLNLEQQKKLCTILNHSKKTGLNTFSNFSPTEIQAILIYLFTTDRPLMLTPLNDEYSSFKVSSWKKEEMLKIQHHKELQELLQTTYDK